MSLDVTIYRWSRGNRHRTDAGDWGAWEEKEVLWASEPWMRNKTEGESELAFWRAFGQPPVVTRHANGVVTFVADSEDDLDRIDETFEPCVAIVPDEIPDDLATEAIDAVDASRCLNVREDGKRAWLDVELENGTVTLEVRFV